VQQVLALRGPSLRLHLVRFLQTDRQAGLNPCVFTSCVSCTQTDRQADRYPGPGERPQPMQGMQCPMPLLTPSLALHVLHAPARNGRQVCETSAAADRSVRRVQEKMRMHMLGAWGKLWPSSLTAHVFCCFGPRLPQYVQSGHLQQPSLESCPHAWLPNGDRVSFSR
jgi:hypothetical protein